MILVYLFCWSIVISLCTGGSPVLLERSFIIDPENIQEPPKVSRGTELGFGTPFPIPKIVRSAPNNRELRIFLAKAYTVRIVGNRSTVPFLAQTALDRFSKRSNSRAYAFPLNSSACFSSIVVHLDGIPSVRPCNSSTCENAEWNVLNNIEAYQIHLDIDAGIHIFCNSGRGAAHAFEVLSGLFFNPVLYKLPLEITDWPARRWRGLMLDVARHFIPIKLILRTIDAMATSRLNILHLHLTDSQSFPVLFNNVVLANGMKLPLSQLALNGSFDAHTKVYTLDNLNTIVQYATERGIEVIPEIDMPAHALSWGSAFRDIIVRCDNLAQRQETPHNIYPLDPSNPKTFLIIEEVLKQITKVFPSQYMHIGGDEVNDLCWQESESLQAWARRQDINPRKITQYFEQHVFRFVLDKLHKTPIVWQGILDADNMPDFSENVSLPTSKNGTKMVAQGHAVTKRRLLREGIDADEQLTIFPRRSSSGNNDSSVNAIVEPWKCWGGLAVRSASKSTNPPINGKSKKDSSYSSNKFPVWMAACLYLDFNSDWTTFLVHDLLQQAIASSTATAKNTARIFARNKSEQPQSSGYMLPSNLSPEKSAFKHNSPIATPPRSLSPEQVQAHEEYFLGGAGALWTECVDASNFECRLWPRAGAIAQNLWGFVPNDHAALSLSLTARDLEDLTLANETNTIPVWKQSIGGDIVLSVAYTQHLYASFVIFRSYLQQTHNVQVAPLVFHYPNRVITNNGASSGGSMRHRVKRGGFSSITSSSLSSSGSSGFIPIYPRNLSRALALVQALELGVTLSSSGPRVLAEPTLVGSKASFSSARQHTHSSAGNTSDLSNNQEETKDHQQRSYQQQLHRYHHYFLMTTQCLAMSNESIQRPLHSEGISVSQLNIADGAMNKQRQASLVQWLQIQAHSGIQLVGLCEMVGWDELPYNSGGSGSSGGYQKVDLVKNLPYVARTAASSGFVYNYLTNARSHSHYHYHPVQHINSTDGAGSAGSSGPSSLRGSTTSTYPVGLLSVFPFEVRSEYHAPYLQRSALHAYLPRLKLHVFVVHLHAHSATLRLRESRFLVAEMRRLGLLRPSSPSQDDSSGSRSDHEDYSVVIMGDFNTLSPYDRGVHEEEGLVTMLRRQDHPIFLRLKKKFLRETRVDRDSGLESDDSYREVDYRPMQTFLDAGFRDVCAEYCCQQVLQRGEDDYSDRQGGSLWKTCKRSAFDADINRRDHYYNDSNSTASSTASTTSVKEEVSNAVVYDGAQLLPTWSFAKARNNNSNDARRNQTNHKKGTSETSSDQGSGISAEEAFAQCMQSTCRGSEPTLYNPEWSQAELNGLSHPTLRLDFILLYTPTRSVAGNTSASTPLTSRALHTPLKAKETQGHHQRTRSNRHPNPSSSSPVAGNESQQRIQPTDAVHEEQLGQRVVFEKAGVDRSDHNNLTAFLSDHYPVYAMWRDRLALPTGVDLF